MSSSSKLAYLSKYTDSVGEKKKKKKKKSKKEKRDFIKDEEDDVGMPALPDEEEDEDEEGPTVVDDSVVVKQEEDVSTERRRRYDSSDEESPRQTKKRRRRDSDDSDEAPSTRRKRYDSGDDDSPHGKPKRWYDSEDEEETKPRRRYDSDDGEESETRRQSRKRYDSDDDSANEQPRYRRRYDSDDDSDDDHSDNQNKPRKRYDSGDDDGGNHKESRRHNDTREKTSSGHSAGLQRAQDFSIAEREIQHQKKLEAQAMVDRHGMGETIYRDKEGRKVDAPPEKSKTPQLSEAQQAELNRGRVQRQQQEAHLREWKEVQESSFARYKDDAALEDAQRDVIREGDPMAMHAARKQTKAAVGRPQRPIYKGPAPKPNRYGIRPGYRWDGVDRGNGFEDKVLASKYSANHKKEQAYRWSSADM